MSDRPGPPCLRAGRHRFIPWFPRGGRRSLEHLEENLAAASLELTADQVAALVTVA